MKKALIVYGGWQGHDPEGVAKLFKEMLEEKDFAVDMSEDLNAFLGDLMQYDLLIPVWTMGELPAGAAKNVKEAVAAGVGLAGCHGGLCDAFRNDCDWQFLTGSQFVAHPGGITTYTVKMCRDVESPLTEGIADFEVTSEQYYLHYDPAVRVLATTHFPVADGDHVPNGDVEMPVVYTKYWGKGRVYYNSLGHTHETFDIPEAKELMLRGMLYAAR